MADSYLSNLPDAALVNVLSNLNDVDKILLNKAFPSLDITDIAYSGRVAEINNMNKQMAATKFNEYMTALYANVVNNVSSSIEKYKAAIAQDQTFLTKFSNILAFQTNAQQTGIQPDKYIQVVKVSVYESVGPDIAKFAGHYEYIQPEHFEKGLTIPQEVLTFCVYYKFDMNFQNIKLRITSHMIEYSTETHDQIYVRLPKENSVTTICDVTIDIGNSAMFNTCVGKFVAKMPPLNQDVFTEHGIYDLSKQAMATEENAWYVHSFKLESNIAHINRIFENLINVMQKIGLSTSSHGGKKRLNAKSQKHRSNSTPKATKKTAIVNVRGLNGKIVAKEVKVYIKDNVQYRKTKTADGTFKFVRIRN